MFWRLTPTLPSLPEIPFVPPSIDPDLPSFPLISPLSLVGFVDHMLHANVPVDPSLALPFCYGGSIIAYKSKVQPVIATSSTVAEFYAAVIAAKLPKYFRSFLTELGFPLQSPTLLYKDNKVAIAMINNSHPTPRVRHLDTQYFAIQEW